MGKGSKAANKTLGVAGDVAKHGDDIADAVGGAFGDMAFAGIATTFGTAAIGGGVTLTLCQTIGVSAFSSIAGGMTSRYVNANLNNAFYGTNRNAAKKSIQSRRYAV